MTPQPKRTPSQAEAERIRRALARKRAAEAELVEAVLEALRNGASLRETALIAEVSERTGARWRQGQDAPSAADGVASVPRGTNGRGWHLEPVADPEDDDPGE